jgi:HK97 family phage portal protein
MGFLARAVAEQKSGDPLAIWAEILRASRSSKAGQSITLETALKVATLFACLKVLSQGVAQVPFKLFQESEINGLSNIAPARKHQIYDLITAKPNDWTTSFEFRETLTIHAAMGNAYAFINRTINGISELILLNPGRVTKKQLKDYSITYDVTGDSGAVQTFPAEAIWHVKGPSWDGLVGMELMNVAREALGLSIATEETHAKLHAKGIRTTGTYSVEGKLNAQQYKDLKAWIQSEMAGADNAGAPMILDSGAKWLPTAMTGIDAQHLETRKYQIEEVCRFTGVSPFMVFYSDKAPTYASAEQFQIQHVVHTLAPWYARIEQSADVNLLTKNERAKGFYFKFMAAGLLRGASKDRAEYYAKALGSGGSQGWMTPDEVRALEELNPMGGAAGMLSAPSNKPAPTATP